MTFQIHLSTRNIPLVFNDALPTDDAKFITVENYLKWYALFVVSKDGVTELQSNNEIHFAGHVPVPADVVAYAEQNNMYIDGQSMEMIVGRWTIENLQKDPEFIGAAHGFSVAAKNITASGHAL